MKRFFSGSTEPLGDREAAVVANTAQLARDGHIVEPAGADLSNFRKNPVWLWNHDPSQPVGVATAVGVSNGQLVARMQFAPPGVSPIADQVCGLVKSGVITGVSIGFDPIDMEPLDRTKPRAGQRISSWELLEISYVSIPSDTGATVTSRSLSNLAALVRSAPSLSAEAIDHARTLAGFVTKDPASRLVAHALHAFGETLDPARARHLVDEARRLGRTAEFHWQWLRASGIRVAAEDRYSAATRRAELEALRE